MTVLTDLVTQVLNQWAYCLKSLVTHRIFKVMGTFENTCNFEMPLLCLCVYIRCFECWHFSSKRTSISCLSWKFTTIYHLFYHAVDCYYILFSNKKPFLLQKYYENHLLFRICFTVGSAIMSDYFVFRIGSIKRSLFKQKHTVTFYRMV